ncbi:TetR/AcrR family transcriptional regulator [Fusibacter paucivorans]|uniref:TetR/AcrR family transcriptional regulator n=1 Tax=Fusibacter paucivorans TaxID=76009 RepID=A0ABS5PK91_9FIRM|nr:TetR/AcrR family transcriptional regulator [Fusibacter paucivorans]MBS7525579.1 TetR/AcrR family transcriptional regulator [Fusibacter paucivorans]
MPKMTNRAKKAIATKKRIYECGVKLMHEKGFGEITISEIAKEAGISVGTYYYYFDSKTDLFKEIFSRVDDFFMTWVKEPMQSDSYSERIISFFEHYAKLVEDDGITTIRKLYTPENKMFTVEGQFMQNVLKEVIEEGQRSGELNTLYSAQRYTNYLFVVGRGIVFEWCLRDGKFDLKQQFRTIISLVVKSMAK